MTLWNLRQNIKIFMKILEKLTTSCSLLILFISSFFAARKCILKRNAELKLYI